MLEDKIGEALAAAALMRDTRPSRELSLAMTKLEEAGFWAGRARELGERERAVAIDPCGAVPHHPV